MIMVFNTHLENDDIFMTDRYLHLSVMRYISGTVYHMIFIYGTHVYKDNISGVFYIFSKF